MRSLTHETHQSVATLLGDLLGTRRRCVWENDQEVHCSLTSLKPLMETSTLSPKVLTDLWHQNPSAPLGGRIIAPQMEMVCHCWQDLSQVNPRLVLTDGLPS